MDSSKPSAVSIFIHGRVQGVGFRFYTQELAQSLNLTGWVKNHPDASVEVYAEGPRSALETLLKEIEKGPPLSRVDTFMPGWTTPQGKLTSFEIR